MAGKRVLIVTTAISLAGCQMGPSEVTTPLVVADTDAVASLEACFDELSATVDAIGAAVYADQSAREVSSEGDGNKVAVDQSTSDRWLGRLLAGGLVLMALGAPSPLGWLRRRVKPV